MLKGLYDSFISFLKECNYVYSTAFFKKSHPQKQKTAENSAIFRLEEFVFL